MCVAFVAFVKFAVMLLFSLRWLPRFRSSHVFAFLFSMWVRFVLVPVSMARCDSGFYSIAWVRKKLSYCGKFDFSTIRFHLGGV
jgi:hypothetical protein